MTDWELVKHGLESILREENPKMKYTLHHNTWGSTVILSGMECWYDFFKDGIKYETGLTIRIMNFIADENGMCITIYTSPIGV